MDFSNSFDLVGEADMELDQMQLELSDPNKASEYLICLAEALAEGTSTRVVGAVSSYQQTVRDFNILDPMFDEANRAKLEAVHEAAIEQEISTLFSTLPFEVDSPHVESMVNGIDATEVQIEVAVRAMLCEQFRANAWSLAQLCITATLLHKPKVRMHLAHFFQSICNRFVFSHDEAISLRRGVEEAFDRDGFSEVFGIMYNAASMSLNRARRLLGEEDDPSSSRV